MTGKSELRAELPPEASFGDLLRHFRRRAGMTQEELAEHARVSARAISDLERGAKHGPHRTTVALLAGALHLSAEERALLESATRRSRGPLRLAEAEQSLALPEPPTSLVGRRRDVEEAVHRLRWSGVRLLTLTGPGGVGKTRVALATARALRDDCPGGPVFVSLAPLRDPHLVGPTVARALGLRDTGGRIEDALAAHLQERDAIIVLDNFEHLTEASALLSSLLPRCSRLRFVVTSRTALKIQGEHRMELAPLEVPAPETPVLGEAVSRYPAVELFAQRAAAARRNFALTDSTLPAVIEICRRLDGLPLAIELAAARIAHLSPQALLMRLSRRLPLLSDGPADLPTRQQTMANAIAWSYDLLDDADQRLLRHLSVFAGGWSLDAAEAVCAEKEAERHSIFPGLSRLIDKSLVLVNDLAGGEPRYHMLETIREFAADRLAASPEADAPRARHAQYFLALAEEAEQHLSGPEQGRWLERLEMDHDNLRGALDWAGSVDDPDLGLRLSAALWRFWFGHGHGEEGRTRIQSFLPKLDRAGSHKLRARVLYAAGALAFGQAHHEEARQHFEASLDLYRGLGDTTQVAVTLNGLGVIASNRGEYDLALPLLREAAALHRTSGADALLAAPLMNMANIVRYRARDAAEMAEAVTLYEECNAIYRRSGNISALANSLNNTALLLADLGPAERAIELATESLALAKALESPGQQAFALTTLGSIAIERGEDDRARPLVEESLELFRRSGDRDMIATGLINLSTLELRRSRLDRAEALVREAHDLLRQTGARRLLGYVFASLGDIARARGDLLQARRQYEESLAICTEVGYVIGIIDALERLSGLSCAEGAWQPAARQFGLAASLRKRLGVPISPVFRGEIERDLACLRRELGEDAFTTAWHEGAAAADRRIPSASS